MRNAILLLLVVSVAAVTALNCYTTRRSTAYFADVSLVEAREMERAKMTAVAQDFASEALALAEFEAGRAGQLEAHVRYLVSMCDSLYSTAEVQSDYIQELAALLKANGIAIPEPTLAEPEPMHMTSLLR